MIVVALLNLKGGTGKTTSAGFLGQALYEAGLSTVGFDADAENEGYALWARAGSLPYPVEPVTGRELHRQIPGIVGDRFEAIVIDTPPMREQRQAVLSAARYATYVVVPMAPTYAEYQRLPAVHALLEEAGQLRGGTRPVMRVLLTRTVPHAASTGVYRELIDEDYGSGTVLRAHIGNRQMYAQAQGQAIKNATNTAYGDALAELMGVQT